TCDAGSSSASSPGFNGSAGSSFAGSTTPAISSALSSLPASLFSSNDFETGSSQRRRSLTDKHLQCVEQRLRIILTLIDGRRHGAALEQDMDRLPGRADGALDGEGYFSGHVDVLADECEIGRTLWNGGRHVAAAPGEPDVVDVGHVARHANR